MIFYISSQGHAATAWMANSFSLHPKVIAFHGIRSIPPVKIDEEYDYFGIQLNELSGYDPIVARNLAKGLHYCSKHSGRVFGAVHTVWGNHMKAPVESYGGTFAGVVRHPINQIHSMMSAYLGFALSHGKLPVDTRMGFEYTDVFSADKELLSRIAELRNAPRKSKKLLGKTILASKLRIDRAVWDKRWNNFSLQEQFNRRSKSAIINLALRRFLQNMRLVFGDHLGFLELENQSVIVMEKMVSGIDYFAEKFQHLTGLRITKDMQSQILDLDHVHKHATKKMTAKQIWELWPHPVQESFSQILESRFKRLYDFYSEQGYWLPTA